MCFWLNFELIVENKVVRDCEEFNHFLRDMMVTGSHELQLFMKFLNIYIQA